MRVMLLLVILLSATPSQFARAEMLDFIPAILAGVNQQKVRINVFSSGPGSFTSDVGLSYDYASGQGVNSKTFTASDDRRITLVANPQGDGQVSFEGCESVSDENRRCTVPLAQDRNVFIRFPPAATIYKNVAVIDVTNASAQVDGEQYTLQADATDAATVQKINGLNNGDYIVSKGTPSFFRHITAVSKSESGKATVTTEFCTLEDILTSGTFQISKKMTNADLADGTNSLKTNGIAGIRLRPASPDSTVFTIQFGDPEADASNSLVDRCFEIKNGDAVAVKLCGEMDVEFNLITSLDMGLLGVKQFQFVPEVKKTDKLTITFTGNYGAVEKKFDLGKLDFARIVTGPIWTDCSLALSLGIEGSVGASMAFSGSMETLTSAGATYDADRTPAWAIINTATTSHNFDEPEFKGSASAKAFIAITPMINIMSATGPAFDISPYVEVSGDYGLIGDCQGLGAKADVGIEGYFKWTFSGSSAIGKFLHLDELENKASFKIGPSHSWTIKQWSLDGMCANADNLGVSGDNFYITLSKGSTQTYTQRFTLKNENDSSVNWSFSGVPGLIAASASNGVINAHSSTDVDVLISPGQLDQGVFDKTFSFSIAQKKFKKNAHIQVYKPLFYSTGTSAFGISVGFNDYSVRVGWNLTSDQLNDVLGFEVYESLDSVNYKMIACIGDKYANSFTANFYPSGSKRWYYISFYGAGGLRAEKYIAFKNFIDSAPK